MTNTLYFCWPGFFVRLQSSFPCLTAEIFPFMTVIKDCTICKWPYLLWISVDVLFWKTLKEAAACKIFSAYRPSESWPWGSWGSITILGTLPEFRCWAGGAGSLELRNRILSSFLLTWHLGVLKWQGALHPGSGCSWAVILIVQPLLLYCRWKLGGWKLQLWSEAVRNCRGISLALQCEWQEPHQLDECCGRWPSCLEREMGSL